MNDLDLLLNKLVEGLYSNESSSNNLKDSLDNLNFFCWVLKRFPNYLEFLSSPFVDNESKKKTIEDTYKDVLNVDVITFLNLLIDRNLIKDIYLIRDKYDTLVKRELNVLKGIIYSAYELNEEEIKRIQDGFFNYLHKKVKLDLIIDKSLILGFKVLINGTMYEYSLDSRLKELKENIKERIEEKTE